MELYNGSYYKNIKNNPMTNKRLFIEHPKSSEFISLTDIIYCRAEKNWTIIVLKGQVFFDICQALKTIEERINSDYFMRVHRSYLVNLHHIEKIQGCYERLEMTEGLSVTISRRRKKELKQALRKVMRLG
ncbi:MAG: LytR/AlgR family response regulator transcription factor [Candidatus Woesearchaeota archaeon]